MPHLGIAIGCLLTVIVEVLFFFAFGYKKKRFVITEIIANVTSNLAINYIIFFNTLNSRSDYYIWLLALEAAVIIYEALIYLWEERKENPRKLEILLLTLAANAASFLVGVGLYSLMDIL